MISVEKQQIFDLGVANFSFQKGVLGVGENFEIVRRSNLRVSEYFENPKA